MIVFTNEDVITTSGLTEAGVYALTDSQMFCRPLAHIFDIVPLFQRLQPLRRDRRISTAAVRIMLVCRVDDRIAFNVRDVLSDDFEWHSDLLYLRYLYYSILGDTVSSLQSLKISSDGWYCLLEFVIPSNCLF